MSLPESKVNFNLSDLTRSVVRLSKEADKVKQTLRDITGQTPVGTSTNSINKIIKSTVEDLKKVDSGLVRIRTLRGGPNRGQEKSTLFSDSGHLFSSIGVQGSPKTKLVQAENSIEGEEKFSAGRTLREARHGLHLIRRVGEAAESGNIGGLAFTGIRTLARAVGGLAAPIAAGVAIGGTIANLAQSVTEDQKAAAEGIKSTYNSERAQALRRASPTERNLRLLAIENSRVSRLRKDTFDVVLTHQTWGQKIQSLFGRQTPVVEQVARITSAKIKVRDLARSLGYSEKKINELEQTPSQDIDWTRAKREAQDGFVRRSVTNIGDYIYMATGNTSIGTWLRQKYDGATSVTFPANIQEVRAMAAERAAQELENEAKRRQAANAKADEIVNNPETGYRWLEDRRNNDFIRRLTRPSMPGLVRD
jgi:hypothetical protein